MPSRPSDPSRDPETTEKDEMRADARDRLVRGVVGDGAARVVAVVATGLVEEAIRRHAAGGAGAIARGRAAVAGLLLATLTKDDERVTLQILGDGPLGTVTVDASSAGTARVFVAHPRATLLPLAPVGTRPSVGQAVGRTGLVNVLRDLGPGTDFSGQTALVDGEVDTDIEDYLLRSEQIESALACETWLDGAGQVRAAVGVLVQALPHGEGAALVARARMRLRAGVLGALFAPSAQVGNDDVDPELVMITALGEDVPTLRVLGENSVRFHCPCSRARAASTLALLGEEDLLALIQEEGQADVTCEFCREHYAFTDASLEEIRHGVRRHAPLPS